MRGSNDKNAIQNENCQLISVKVKTIKFLDQPHTHTQIKLHTNTHTELLGVFLSDNRKTFWK